MSVGGRHVLRAGGLPGEDTAGLTAGGLAIVSSFPQATLWGRSVWVCHGELYHCYHVQPRVFGGRDDLVVVVSEESEEQSTFRDVLWWQGLLELELMGPGR